MIDQYYSLQFKLVRILPGDVQITFLESTFPKHILFGLKKDELCGFEAFADSTKGSPVNISTPLTLYLYNSMKSIMKTWPISLSRFFIKAEPFNSSTQEGTIRLSEADLSEP